MMKTIFYVIFCAFIFTTGYARFVDANAEKSSEIVTSGEYHINVFDKFVSNFSARNLLGTHSLWWGYQKDLVSPITNKSYPSVLSFFYRTKGVIRYGGGANEIPWEACTGPVSSRKKVKAVSWAGPMQCRFGIEEYLSVVRASDGKESWLIANIAGTDYELLPMNQMVTTIGQAALYMKRSAVNLKRYWELGNELERGRYGWSPEKIARRASAAGVEISKIDTNARLILPLIEYDANKQPVRKVFNERLLRSMSHEVNGISLHLYYDGAPGGPSIPTQIRTVVESATLFREINGRQGEVWVTEHGRWPEGDTRSNNWEAQWYKTNDMDGVMATADFLIALAQVEDVAGAMLHGLRAGPWNVFEKSNHEPYLTGVGQLLDLFSEASSGNRLETRTVSLNQSKYKGGYDMRASAFVSPDNKIISLWVVNRSPVAITSQLTMPRHAVAAKLIKGSSLLCPLVDGRCSGDQFKVFQVNPEQVKYNQDKLKLTLPSRSVSVFQFGYMQ